MKRELVVMGEAFDDFVFHGLPRIPLAGEELKTEHFARTVGGGCLITACASARLGVSTHVSSGLSAEAESFLRREGISFTNLRRTDEPSALSVALSTASERAFVTFEGANPLLEDRILASLHELDSLATRHLHLALTPREVSRWPGAIESLRSRGMTVSWDVGFDPLLREFPTIVRALDLFFCNEAEALLYSGAETLDEAVRFWQRNAALVVIKRGAAGCLWVRPDATGARKPYPVEARETTGAGDAFNGGYLQAFLEGRSFEECLERGNRVGALSTRLPGGVDGLPRREELS